MNLACGAYEKSLASPCVLDLSVIDTLNQADVDQAPTLAAMLKDFQVNFVERHNLFTKQNQSVWVTDGPWVCFTNL